jgi:uncharacterized protein DUF3237
MQDPFLVMQAASLVERVDRPLPSGVIPPGSAPVVAVGAQPRHPGNAVLVEMRREGGPGQFLRVVSEVVPFQQEAQWFRALLPTLERGRSVDYRVELVRAGQLLATLPADGSWLTVTGGPAPSSAPAPPCPTASLAGVPQWGYDLQFFAAGTVALRPEIIGETPEGYRINFFVESGRVVGPRIDAVVRRDGGDWLFVRRDGVGQMDVRMTFETADGALISYRSGGVLDLGPDGYARVAAGQFTGSPPFYATPTFMTAHPRWQWLNRIQGFGFGKVMMEERQIRYDIYIPQVLDRPHDG